MMSLGACVKTSDQITTLKSAPLPVWPQECAVDYYEAVVKNNSVILADPVRKKCFTHWIDKIDEQQLLLDKYHKVP